MFERCRKPSQLRGENQQDDIEVNSERQSVGFWGKVSARKQGLSGVRRWSGECRWDLSQNMLPQACEAKRCYLTGTVGVWEFHRILPPLLWFYLVWWVPVWRELDNRLRQTASYTCTVSKGTEGDLKDWHKSSPLVEFMTDKVQSAMTWMCFAVCGNSLQWSPSPGTVWRNALEPVLKCTKSLCTGISQGD